MYHLAGTLLGAALMYVAPRVHCWPLTYVATDLTFSSSSRPSLGVWVPVHPEKEI